MKWSSTIAFALLTGCGASAGGGETTESSSPVAPTCQDYLSCSAVVFPEGQGQAEADYGADSSCWADDDSASRCEEACDLALQSLQQGGAFDEACWPEGLPVFLEGAWDAYVVNLGFTFSAELLATDDGFTIALEGDDPYPCTLDGADFTCEASTGTFTSPTSAEATEETGFGTMEAEYTYVGPL